MPFNMLPTSITKLFVLEAHYRSGNLLKHFNYMKYVVQQMIKVIYFSTFRLTVSWIF